MAKGQKGPRSVKGKKSKKRKKGQDKPQCGNVEQVKSPVRESSPEPASQPTPELIDLLVHYRELAAEVTYSRLTPSGRSRVRRLSRALDQLSAPLASSEREDLRRLLWAFQVDYAPLLDDGLIDQLFLLEELRSAQPSSSEQSNTNLYRANRLEAEIRARFVQEFSSASCGDPSSAGPEASSVHRGDPSSVGPEASSVHRGSPSPALSADKFLGDAHQLFALLSKLALPPRENGEIPSRDEPFYLIGEYYSLVVSTQDCDGFTPEERRVLEDLTLFHL